MQTSTNTLLYFYEHYELSATLLIMIMFGIIFIYSMSWLVNGFIRKLIEQKYPKYSAIFAKKGLYGQAVQVFFIIYVIFCSKYLQHLPDLNEAFLWTKHIVVQSYVILAIMNSIITFTNIIVSINKAHLFSSKIPVMLYGQIFKIITVICGILAIISTVVGIAVSSLFTSLGAAAAVFSLVFKDALISLVASLQVTFQDVVRIGDWITIEDKGKTINGVVEKITVTLVMIRNFDGTITTVTADALLNGTVRNWRYIYPTGTRSINRSINLDISSIKICDQHSFKEIKTLPLMQKNTDNEELFSIKNAVTNFSLFKYYTNLYLAYQQALHKDSFTFLIKHSEISSTENLSLELYIFAKESDLNKYNNFLSMTLQHLTSILTKFNLNSSELNIQLPTK
ncbi:MAG: mechanosensitive ion channel [Rickettsiaceae bacterium]|nr:mechanosensitive ion channel [Rickettsiaceae bacterium]